MDEVNRTLVTRVRAARADVEDAVRAHDQAAVGRAMDELEHALRAARQGGVDVPPAGADDDGRRERG